MGMDRRVRFVGGRLPEWSAVVAALAEAGLPVQMRMIDGELAFPDETPPETCRELRVAHAGAMATVRRGQQEIILVTWGNADEQAQKLWNALAWAFARVGDGQVLTEAGPMDAAAFAQQIGLP